MTNGADIFGVAVLLARGQNGVCLICMTQCGNSVGNITIVTDRAGVFGVAVLLTGRRNGIRLIYMTQCGNAVGNITIVTDRAGVFGVALLLARGRNGICLICMTQCGNDLVFGRAADKTFSHLLPVSFAGGRSNYFPFTESMGGERSIRTLVYKQIAAVATFKLGISARCAGCLYHAFNIVVLTLWRRHNLSVPARFTNAHAFALAYAGSGRYYLPFSEVMADRLGIRLFVYITEAAIFAYIFSVAPLFTVRRYNVSNIIVRSNGHKIALVLVAADCAYIVCIPLTLAGRRNDSLSICVLQWQNYSIILFNNYSAVGVRIIASAILAVPVLYVAAIYTIGCNIVKVNGHAYMLLLTLISGIVAVVRRNGLTAVVFTA